MTDLSRSDSTASIMLKAKVPSGLQTCSDRKYLWLLQASNCGQLCYTREGTRTDIL